MSPSAVVLPQSGREITWKFEVDKQSLTLPVSSYLLFDYAEALLEAAIAGAGLIQAPQYIVARAIQRGEPGRSLLPIPEVEPVTSATRFWVRSWSMGSVIGLTA
jgi:LysR family transcriptional regulator, regulator for bpeEF and oprC